MFVFRVLKITRNKLTKRYPTLCENRKILTQRHRDTELSPVFSAPLCLCVKVFGVFCSGCGDFGEIFRLGA
jgi:hypothetical protein